MIFYNSDGTAIVTRKVHKIPLQFEKNKRAFVTVTEGKHSAKIHLKDMGNGIWISKIRGYYVVKELCGDNHISHYKYSYGFYIWNNGFLFTEIVPNFESLGKDFMDVVNVEFEEI